MHPTENIETLRALAREVQTYQLERDWSDARTCKEIAALGSTKTYKRILDPADELEELSIDNQLRSYQAAVELVVMRRSQDKPAELEYDDFTNIVEARAAIAAALQEDSVARLVIIEGANGTGKDAVRNNLLRTWGKMIIPVEATEFWVESLSVPTNDILVAMNIVRHGENGEPFRIPRFPSDRLNLIIEEGQKRKRVLLVNEAHHMGPRTLNLMKTIINRSEWVVVWLCIPKLIQDVLKANYQESIQLVGNRLCARVKLPTPPADEILKLMQRRRVVFADVAAENTTATKLECEAPSYGNWRFVNFFIRRALQRCADRPLDLAAVSKLLVDTKARRITTSAGR